MKREIPYSQTTNKKHNIVIKKIRKNMRGDMIKTMDPKVSFPADYIQFPQITKKKPPPKAHSKQGIRKTSSYIYEDIRGITHTF